MARLAARGGDAVLRRRDADHLSPEELRRLLVVAKEWFPLAAGYELSVEANPADIDEAKVEVLAECGVTRVSLGVQSFHAGKLKLLERDHDAGQVVRAVGLLRSRIQSVSLDLIFGTPGETLGRVAGRLGPGTRPRARSPFDLRPDVRARDGLLVTIARGGTGPGRGRPGTANVRNGDRQANGGRIRALRGFELRPTGAPLSPQRDLLDRPGLFRRRAGGLAIRGWKAREQIIAARRPISSESWPANRPWPKARTLARGFGPRAARVWPAAIGRDRRSTVRSGDRLLVDSLAGESLPALVEHGLLSRAGGRFKLTRRGSTSERCNLAEVFAELEILRSDPA